MKEDDELRLQNWVAGIKRTCTQCEDLPTFATRKDFGIHHKVHCKPKEKG